MKLVGYCQAKARIITNDGGVIDTTTPYYPEGIASIGMQRGVRPEVFKFLPHNPIPIIAKLDHMAFDGTVVYLEVTPV